jgi:geranylgeranyl pyrophosphate synthase
VASTLRERLGAELAAAIADSDLEREIRAGLGAVEETLRASVKSDYGLLAETARHLVDAGGKRFRPLLVLLAAQYGDPGAPGVVPAAVVVELTHLATLYHDDVMDEADIRRGAQSANSRWDNTVAILTGDFLFARASDILADLGPEAVRIQARTFERLVQGQIRETAGPEQGVDPVEHHLRVIADKTASLISTSGRFGAMLSGASETATETLARYGERVGVAFQLSDDLLDIDGEVGLSGKVPGTDLREGVPTLPVLLVRRDNRDEDARLIELLDSDLHDPDLHAEALALLRAHPAMESARATLRSYATEARDALSSLPDRPVTAALAGLCDVVVARHA